MPAKPLIADFTPESLRDVLGREAARQVGRDFAEVRSMDFMLVRETRDNGTETLSGARVTLHWNDGTPASRPAPAIEAVGAEL